MDIFCTHFSHLRVNLRNVMSSLWTPPRRKAWPTSMGLQLWSLTQSISNIHPPRTWHRVPSAPRHAWFFSVGQRLSGKERSSRGLLYRMETPKEVAISLSILIVYTSGSPCIRCELKSIWSDLLHCFQRHLVWILEDWKEKLKDKSRSSKLCNAKEYRKQYNRFKNVNEIILI